LSRRGHARIPVAAAACLVAVSCTQPAPPAGGPGVLEADALKLLARYDDAWNRKDWQAVDRILAPQYVYLSSKGRLSDRTWAKKMMESPAYRLDTTHRDEIVAHRSGSTVVVGSRWRGSGTYDGKPFTDDQRCSVVVAFADGEGRVLSEHCTAIAAD
jgi:hypothetical protein